MEYMIEEAASASSTAGSASTIIADKMFFLQNKPPKWDEEHKGHVLNFHVSKLTNNYKLTKESTLYYPI